MQIGTLVFPDSEVHFAAHPHIEDYQVEQYEVAISYCRTRRTALDVGAHVGIFSRRMAVDFERVIAYEPNPDLHAAWAENLAAHPNADLDRRAVMDGVGEAVVRCTVNGWSHLVDPRVPPSDIPAKLPSRTVAIPSTTLDSTDFHAVDFVKIDVQGAEALVLAGARETLARCRPVVLLEEKAKSAPAVIAAQRAARVLTSLGARRVRRVGADAIWVFP